MLSWICDNETTTKPNQAQSGMGLVTYHDLPPTGNKPTQNQFLKLEKPILKILLGRTGAGAKLCRPIFV